MSELVRQATCITIAGRGLLIEGEPGSGKSSLALALIDRGAILVGDDGVVLSAADGQLMARPHPATRGLIEVRGLGLVPVPVAESAPVALVVRLDASAPRFIEAAGTISIAGIDLPLVSLDPAGSNLHLRAELALRQYGLFRS
jgi:serine kinase of HPr protein (carbohydrate metabolism regulator)